MTLAPVIEREMRTQARLPFTYGLRMLSGAAVLLAALMYVFRVRDGRSRRAQRPPARRERIVQLSDLHAGGGDLDHRAADVGGLHQPGEAGGDAGAVVSDAAAGAGDRAGERAGARVAGADTVAGGGAARC